MIWDHIGILRKYIAEKSTWPFDDWSELLSQTNCLAFALGLAVDLGDDYLDFGHLFETNSKLTKSDFSGTFERLLTELDLQWRKITSPDEALNDEYIIQTYGLYDLDCFPYYDFHVIRRDLNGVWVHKPSFRYRPEIIEWKSFSLIYLPKDICGIYAVKKKTP